MKIKRYKLGKQKGLTITTKYVILTVITLGKKFRIQLEIANFGK